MTGVIARHSDADRSLTGQLLSSASESELYKIEHWAAHDGLLLVSESIFKLLLDHELDEDEECNEDTADEVPDEDEHVTKARKQGASEGKKKAPSRLSVEAQALCEQLLLDPFIIVIDEAHRIQNPNSKMTKVSG